MYVCICKAVTDRDILDAVDDGHQTLDEISERLGAGTCCGTCREHTVALIESRLAESLSYAAAG